MWVFEVHFVGVSIHMAFNHLVARPEAAFLFANSIHNRIAYWKLWYDAGVCQKGVHAALEFTGQT